MSYASIALAVASALPHLVGPSLAEASTSPAASQTALVAEAPRITVRSVAPRRTANPSAQAAQRLATGNKSLVFYQVDQPRGQLGALSNGEYSFRSTFRLPAGFTHMAVSRGSAFFYNSKTGAAVSGIIREGAYTTKRTFALDAGWNIIAASCDSLLLYNFQTESGWIGTFSRGVFTVTATFTAKPVEQIAASCDALVFYNNSGGTALATFENGAIGPATSKTLGAGWDIIAPTADSVMFYDRAHRTGAWGTLIAGAFTQTGSTGGFSYWSHIAGTADSLLF